ncbi:hypothetical protein C5F47_05285 [Nitrosopumilus cobalaminigenes]|uniref:Uncharacterized protein n=1 Tax=Nitrosopumilus cobalaminigenes TaxID=1470066 RepID=A0A7D5R6S7_9ARCH|nr:hypothetical protein [Nitrosopumilus cobalaminigenes]QLH03002.1 hypothetical protein C5F47_05285 [Nitrosopumilus cobalaminigenes]
MSTESISFIKWGECHSKNPDKPDVLECKVVKTETMDSELTTNVHVQQRIHDSWEDRLLPLKSHESHNSSLLKSWNELVKHKKIVADTKFQLKTYLGLSKNNRPIRRSEIIL